MVRVKAAMAALAMRKTGVLLFMMSLLCSPAAGSAHRRHDTNTGRTDASSAAPLPTATRQSMTAWRARHAVRASGRSPDLQGRSEEHTSELQSLMRISYAVFCLKKKIQMSHTTTTIRRYRYPHTH